jgi:hypothetical protein
MRGYAEKDGIRIGFGEVKAKVLPVKWFNCIIIKKGF